MAIAGAKELTPAAISDVLAQTVPTKLLLIGQGLDDDFRRELELICEAHDERVFGWWFEPSVSLSAAWNRGLRFAWECGAEWAWVLNNDVRVSRHTGRLLAKALDYTGAGLVSAVGVTDEQFWRLPSDMDTHPPGLPKAWFRDNGPDLNTGGPDFSNFVLRHGYHDKYPFDENFFPAYGEDVDLHRRYMLGGDGDNIFSVNLPYLHVGGGSGTLKAMTPEARAVKERQIGGSRAYYEKKWGGPVNQERFTIPFDAETAQGGVTTPELQRAGMLTAVDS